MFERNLKIGSLLMLFAAVLVMTNAAFSQTPSIEPGVSQELAKWRAADYSDVRYKLNLTLEKMSPVLKGTIEIRVRVSGGDGEKRSGGAQAETRPVGSVPPIILDWRKIKGHEDKSTVSNVTINGKHATLENHPVAETATPLLRKEGSFLYQESNEHLVFRDGVVAGENVIKLDFTSPILTSGSAITRYVDKEDGSEYIYSLFVPSDASTAFPVFDQPALKARFSLSINSSANWNVVSNSPLADERTKYLKALANHPHNKISDPTWTETFPETKPISTYVFAFAAGPFERVSVPPAVAGGSMSVPGTVVTGEVKEKSPVATAPGTDKATDLGTSIYVRKSQAAKFKPHAAEVFRLNREAIKYFEEYFDYQFPWPKYDLVLIPEFPFGGMEHAGATFLRESSIIFPQEPTKNDHISRATLIFHEASHQWFGDTVTMRWFDDLWLKEGFATFTAYKAMEKIMPEMNAWKVFYERVKQGAYQTDSTKGTTPIYQEIKNLSAAKSAYGAIVYNKAPAFLRQAEFYLGEDKFQTAVRAFLKKHEFGNAGWEDLVREFEASSGKDSNTMKLWAEQWVKQRGVPVVRAEHSHLVSNNEIFSYGLSQRAAPETNAGENNRWWTLYFNLYAKFPNEKTQIKRQFLDFEGEEPWRRDLPNQQLPTFVFPNYQDYGYGIFLLDDKSRDYVLKNIQNEKDPFLRSMMWGALWDSVREGELDPRVYVELVVKVLSKSDGFSRHSPGQGTPKGVTLAEDESTIATLLNRVGTAMNYYLSEPPAVAGGLTRGDQPPTTVGGSDLRLRLENLLIDRMRNAETLGQRITYYRAFLNVAASENGRKVLKAMLKAEPSALADGFLNSGGTKNPPANAGGSASAATVNVRAEKTVPLKTKDRFDIVTRLLILNDPDAPKLLANLERTEKSDDAKRDAYAAKAGIASAENKAKYWNDFTNNKEISESWIEAAFGPWNSIRHSDLTLPYLQKALQELPNHKRNRKIFFVNGWLGAFIGGQRSEEALNIVNRFLTDNPNLDKDLRLKILENVDLIERAVKIRAKDGRN